MEILKDPADRLSHKTRELMLSRTHALPTVAGVTATVQADEQWRVRTHG